MTYEAGLWGCSAGVSGDGKNFSSQLRSDLLAGLRRSRLLNGWAFTSLVELSLQQSPSVASLLLCCSHDHSSGSQSCESPSPYDNPAMWFLGYVSVLSVILAQIWWNFSSLSEKHTSHTHVWAERVNLVSHWQRRDATKAGGAVRVQKSPHGVLEWMAWTRWSHEQRPPGFSSLTCRDGEQAREKQKERKGEQSNVHISSGGKMIWERERRFLWLSIAL